MKPLLRYDLINLSLVIIHLTPNYKKIKEHIKYTHVQISCEYFKTDLFKSTISDLFLPFDSIVLHLMAYFKYEVNSQIVHVLANTAISPEENAENQI
jgi:hypothetical protein